MRKQIKPHVFVLRLAAVLLILVMLSTSMLAGRYARYASSTTGSASARVARFSVTETSDLLTESILLDVHPGQPDQVAIQVDNDSEVAIRYCIDVVSSGNLPLQFQVKVDDTAYPIPFEGSMSPDSSETYTLIASWNGAADISYAGMVDQLQVSLQAIQLD